ncbi:hypothetical protein F4780DRAFT_707144 [Xylariomycetidae sp. FL0641]|nr:hypothetical protein F4780DRAFT_707144 [Xylariomycetidae sp. FL0641]
MSTVDTRLPPIPRDGGFLVSTSCHHKTPPTWPPERNQPYILPRCRPPPHPPRASWSPWGVSVRGGGRQPTAYPQALQRVLGVGRWTARHNTVPLPWGRSPAATHNSVPPPRGRPPLRLLSQPLADPGSGHTRAGLPQPANNKGPRAIPRVPDWLSPPTAANTTTSRSTKLNPAHQQLHLPWHPHYPWGCLGRALLTRPRSAQNQAPAVKGGRRKKEEKDKKGVTGKQRRMGRRRRGTGCSPSRTTDRTCGRFCVAVPTTREATTLTTPPSPTSIISLLRRPASRRHWIPASSSTTEVLRSRSQISIINTPWIRTRTSRYSQTVTTPVCPLRPRLPWGASKTRLRLHKSILATPRCSTTPGPPNSGHSTRPFSIRGCPTSTSPLISNSTSAWGRRLPLLRLQEGPPPTCRRMQARRACRRPAARRRRYSRPRSWTRRA